jgi:homoserine kinase type II
MKVHMLWHVHELPGGEEDAKLIGIYSTPSRAKAARKRAAKLAGFKDCLRGFQISPREVDKDSWTEGYVTIPR